MNLFLRIAQAYVPPHMKRKELRNLFEITASAFGCVVPPIAGRSFDERLAEYARFTRAEVEKSLAVRKDAQARQDRLYRYAMLFGRRFRKRFGVSTAAEAFAVSRLLYRVIGIDVHYSAEGEMTVSSCFFSSFYPPEVCRFVSSLDEGVCAGLTGGGRLVFSQRITEGCDCCKAHFVPKESI